jgi:NAD-reducing hydrogenase small subunit
MPGVNGPESGEQSRPRLATVWLGGCSGCHMSFLDLDEWLFELTELVDVVYSPLADVKTFPTDVDIALVEGAVANTDNQELAELVRARSKLVVAFGDCAVTGNVTAMRNPLGDPSRILQRVYVEKVDRDGQVPDVAVPALLPQVVPLHRMVDVDVFLPGCPPPAGRIKEVVCRLLDGTLSAATTLSVKGTIARGGEIRFG